MPPWNPAHEILAAGTANAAQTSKNLLLPSKLGLSPSLITAEQHWSFLAQFCSPSPLHLSSFLPSSFFPACPNHNSCCLLCMAASRDGEPGNGCYSRERGAMEVTFVLAHVGKQSVGGLWSSNSVYSALKSADRKSSSHPENYLNYTWQLVTAAVDSSLRL